MSLYQVLFLVTEGADADSQVDHPVQVQATDEASAIELARAQLRIRAPHVDVAKLQVYSVWKMDGDWPDDRPTLKPAFGNSTVTALVLQTVITCPRCGTSTAEIMPIIARRLFYECTHCHALLQPRDGDCCVFCSYGSVKCPFAQEQAGQG